MVDTVTIVEFVFILFLQVVMDMIPLLQTTTQKVYALNVSLISKGTLQRFKQQQQQHNHHVVMKWYRTGNHNNIDRYYMSSNNNNDITSSSSSSNDVPIHSLNETPSSKQHQPHSIVTQQKQPQLILPCQPNTPITTVMAPMVSSSDYAFRCLVRQYNTINNNNNLNTPPSSSSSSSPSSTCNGSSNVLTFTQMLHAHNLVRDKTFYQNHYDIFEYDNEVDNDDYNSKRILTESQRNLYNDPNVDRYKYILSPSTIATAKHGPVIAQLAGSNIETIVKAAQMIVDATNGKIAGIDLNLGCPQNIARKGNYGAYLMENHPNIVYTILKTLRTSLPDNILVSAKIRLPYNPNEQKVRLQQLCDTGINFITIHGRDYTENKTTIRNVHIDRLQQSINTINEYTNYRIPVIVNGGIEFVHDAIQIQTQTGAAAIMSSEALLERPSLLGEINSYYQLSGTTTSSSSTSSSPLVTIAMNKQHLNEQIQFATDYIQWCYYMPPLSFGLGNKGGSFNVVRGHLFKILFRYLKDDMNTDLRDWLANGYTMQRLDQAQELIQTLYNRYNTLSDNDWEIKLFSSNFPESTWYRRHRASSLFVHQRIKPNYSHNNNNNNHCFVSDDDKSTTTTAENSEISINIDERKKLIREKIKQLRMQKKIHVNLN